jgi:two-component system, LuxR family, sensor kinase FixL
MTEERFGNPYKDLFQKTSDLIHFVSFEGNVISANPTWLETLEYSLDEVQGRPIFDFIDPACLAEFKSYRAQILSINNKPDSSVPGVIQTVFRTKTGKKINLEGHVSAFVEGSNVIYTRGVFRNITDKVHAEKRLTSFFQSAPDAIIVINADDIILEWNPKAEEIFGFKTDEIIGKSLVDTIIPEQYRDGHRRGMQHFIKTGEGPVLNKTIEITAINKQAQEFFITLSISSVKLDDTWIFIAFVSDITDRKKTEDQLIRREAELLQSRLLDDRKDEFLSIASHELKTPLTTIKAYTQIALSHAVKHDLRNITQYLEKVNQYTSKLNNLINELLDVSKIQAGKLKVNTVALDISHYLSEVILSIQHITPTHKIRLLQNDRAIVRVDPLRIEQVITNIISNAAKYSPGREEILVKSVLDSEKITISITDYGIGISSENLDSIFTRFYRVEESSKDFSGLGIGLFVASEIIKQHGGKIWADSVKGKYTTFFISLPAVELSAGL